MTSPVAPFFVVGCARSGTTLLRVMLDAHPLVAVPPESHFLASLAPRDVSAPFPVARILDHPRVPLWELDAAELLEAEQTSGPWTFAEAADAVFSAYATARGKPVWADKTPGYVEHLPLLARHFPEARFVHLIRDGREVARSLAEWPWGPASPVAGGFWWRRKVQRGRRDGRSLGDRYRELRLEDLVAAPETELGGLCTFLGLDFDPAMLRYADHADRRMQDPAETWLFLTHPHLADPPMLGLRDWRDGLSAADQRAVTAACGAQLGALGYEPDAVGPLDVARAWAGRAAAAARTARRDLGARLRPTRDV